MAIRWNWSACEIPKTAEEGGCDNCGCLIGDDVYHIDFRDISAALSDTLEAMFRKSGTDLYEAFFCKECKDLINEKLKEIDDRTSTP